MDFTDVADLATLREIGTSDGDYANMKALAHWETSSVGLVKAGSKTWFPNDPPSGNPFVFLFCDGRILGRTFTGLVPSRGYLLSFWAAERRGYGSAEQFRVTVNGVAVAERINPAAAWARHSVVFTADHFGEAKLEIENTTPRPDGTTGCPGMALYFADFAVVATRDCGLGASCHEPIPPQKTFTCHCDGGGFVGKAVVGGAAKCNASADFGERLDELTALVGTLERGLSALVTRVGSVQDSVAAADRKSDLLQDLLTRMTDALQLGAAVVPSASLAVGKEPSPDNLVQPAIVAEGGGFDLMVQPGRHATVNGAALLTADEVTTLIRDAISGALMKVGNATRATD